MNYGHQNMIHVVRNTEQLMHVTIFFLIMALIPIEVISGPFTSPSGQTYEIKSMGLILAGSGDKSFSFSYEVKTIEDRNQLLTNALDLISEAGAQALKVKLDYLTIIAVQTKFKGILTYAEQYGIGFKKDKFNLWHLQMSESVLDDNVYNNPLLGFKITKPESWYVGCTVYPEPRDSDIDVRNERVNFVSQICRGNFLMFHKNPEPSYELNPSINAGLVPEELITESDPIKLHQMLFANFQKAGNYVSIEEPTKVTISGSSGVYSRIEMDVSFPGKILPVEVQMYTWRHGDTMYQVNMVYTPHEGAEKDKVLAEYKEIVATISNDLD